MHNYNTQSLKELQLSQSTVNLAKHIAIKVHRYNKHNKILGLYEPHNILSQIKLQALLFLTMWEILNVNAVEHCFTINTQGQNFQFPIDDFPIFKNGILFKTLETEVKLDSIYPISENINSVIDNIVWKFAHMADDILIDFCKRPLSRNLESALINGFNSQDFIDFIYSSSPTNIANNVLYPTKIVNNVLYFKSLEKENSDMIYFKSLKKQNTEMEEVKITTVNSKIVIFFVFVVMFSLAYIANYHKPFFNAKPTLYEKSTI
jgi:hypothetical protein